MTQSQRVLLGLFEEDAMVAVRRVDVSFNRCDDVASQVAFERKVAEFARRREGVVVEVRGMGGKWEVEEELGKRVVV